MDIFEHPDFDEHEMVVWCTDRLTGLRAIIAIHNTVLGPGMGGCRMKRYLSDSEALGDALRLSRGMTYKYAASGLDYGGAKAVILDDGSSDRTVVLKAFARFVERLGGQYTTAEDAGIETADVRVMSSVTRYVRNLPLEDTGDGALCTATGVLQGMSSALAFRGLGGLSGRTVAVEGLGKVGMSLCSLLAEAGTKLVVYDIDEEKSALARDRFGAVAVGPGSIHAVDADIYSPCALGGTLNASTIPEIKATVISGAANNQLGDPRDDDLLWSRGITYCPDFVVNAGGVLSVAEPGTVFSRESALQRVARIWQTTAQVLELSLKEQMPTGKAAERLALLRLGS